MLQKEKRWLVFRSYPPAVPMLPLGVRSAGYYQVPRGWADSPRQKWFLQLFWGVQGSGQLRVKDEWVTVRPNDIFIYFPGDIHEIKVTSEKWIYGWLTFDHKDITQWLDGFGLNQRVTQAGPCPSHYIFKIRKELEKRTAEGERNAASLAHCFLVEASARTGIGLPTSLAIQAKEQLDRNFTRHDFGVETLAIKLNVHRSTLFRQFLLAYGLTPSTYLRNLRIQHGLALLRQSDAPVQEISALSGFTDTNYFARTLRQATGMSPTEFRRS